MSVVTPFQTLDMAIDRHRASGLSGPAIFEKVIFYYTSGPNGGLRSARSYRENR
jgi:hypothetical protein